MVKAISVAYDFSSNTGTVDHRQSTLPPSGTFHPATTWIVHTRITAIVAVRAIVGPGCATAPTLPYLGHLQLEEIPHIEAAQLNQYLPTTLMNQPRFC